MKLKYIGLLIIILIIAILYFYINPSSALFPKCPLYTTTGIYCPGCGSQRAFHDLLHLSFKEVIGHNILFLGGILVLAYHLTITLLNKYFNSDIKNLLYSKNTPKIILVIVILFWVLRNIPIYPFTMLAP